MEARYHTHPKYMLWFKYIFVLLALVRPIYIFTDFFLSLSSFNPIIVLYLVIQESFVLLFVLVAIYYFQDIWVDDEGLLIEFLWKKIRVQWSDVEEIKPVMLGRTVIVIVKKLTPFHKLFGFIYGFSTKPAFVIAPTLIDNELLKKDIRHHVEENHKLGKKDLS